MYYEAIITNLVEKYQHLHDGEIMTAHRLDASVLESVMRKPKASPKSHAEFLHMEYDQVLDPALFWYQQSGLAGFDEPAAEGFQRLI